MGRKILWGVSGLHHDAGLCVIIKDGENFECVYASQAERYTRVKNSSVITFEQVDEAMVYGMPDVVYWYETPWKVKFRQALSGNFDHEHTGVKYSPEDMLLPLLRAWGLDTSAIDWVNGNHHLSHVYSGLATLPPGLQHRPVLSLVMDAVGEFTTTSTWKTVRGKTKKLSSWRYPKSLGLLYAQVTKALGYKPLQDEYRVMGLASKFYGSRFHELAGDIRQCLDGPLDKGLPSHILKAFDHYEPEIVATALQQTLEFETYELLTRALESFDVEEHQAAVLSLSGGVAQNCVNNFFLSRCTEKDTWVFPNPSDSGACIGAVMQHFPGKYVRWDPFLGTDVGHFTGQDLADVIHELKTNKVCGVAQGRAEFGPRALGHRSILGDPRGSTTEVKDRINEIKGRDNVPVAPAILQGCEPQVLLTHLPRLGHAYRYMQATSPADQGAWFNYRSVVHDNRTVRPQIVGPLDPLYPILYSWYKETRCPLLINTSLNAGTPMVNTVEDVEDFVERTGLKVVYHRESS